MSTTVLKRTENSNNLPDDVFNYNHDEFYEFIRETRGVDIAELFSFQAIRHATHLMDTQGGKCRFGTPSTSAPSQHLSTFSAPQHLFSTFSAPSQ